MGLLGLDGELEALDPPVEAGEDGVVRELEGLCIVGGDEVGGAPEVEGLSGEGVGQKLLDVLVDDRDEAEDCFEVEPLFSSRGRGGVERCHEKMLAC